jgi:hypothetical protein
LRNDVIALQYCRRRRLNDQVIRHIARGEAEAGSHVADCMAPAALVHGGVGAYLDHDVRLDADVAGGACPPGQGEFWRSRVVGSFGTWMASPSGGRTGTSSSRSAAPMSESSRVVVWRAGVFDGGGAFIRMLACGLRRSGGTRTPDYPQARYRRSRIRLDASRWYRLSRDLNVAAGVTAMPRREGGRGLKVWFREVSQTPSLCGMVSARLPATDARHGCEMHGFSCADVPVLGLRQARAGHGRAGVSADRSVKGRDMAMSTADSATVRPGLFHEECLRSPSAGWSVCATAWAHGVGAVVCGADRVRVVLAEPATRARQAGLTNQTRLAVARLLAVGMSVDESLDALRLLNTRQLGSGSPGPSLALLDLHRSGLVQLAGRIAPSALYVPRVGAARSHPWGGDGTCQELQLSDGDSIIAFSPSFVELISTTVLAELPDRTRRDSDPCRTRDSLDTCLEKALGSQVVNHIPPAAFASRM